MKHFLFRQKYNSSSSRLSLNVEKLEQRAMLSAYTIKVVDALNLIPASVESQITRTATYGMGLISNYVNWKGTLDVEVRVRPASENPSPTVDGLMPSIISTTNIGDKWSNDTLSEMLSGIDRKPSVADAGMTIYLGKDGQIRNYGSLVWFDPQPERFVPPKVPAGKFDFIGVFVHEVFHGIGFHAGSKEFQQLTKSSSGYDYFIGANTARAYGGPLPLAPRVGGYLNDHYGNTSLTGNKLTSGLMFQWGNYEQNRLDIGVLDLAVLQDLGLTINSTTGLSLVDALDTQRPLAKLSAQSIAENERIGSSVATISAPNNAAGSSFSLVGNVSDNLAFRIVGDRLVTATRFDYEQKNLYSLLIRVTDQSGAFTDTPIAVAVRDVREPAKFGYVPSAFLGSQFLCPISGIRVDGDSRAVSMTLSVPYGRINAFSTNAVRVSGAAAARTFSGTPSALTEYFRLNRVTFGQEITTVVASPSISLAVGKIPTLPLITITLRDESAVSVVTVPMRIRGLQAL